MATMRHRMSLIGMLSSVAICFFASVPSVLSAQPFPSRQQWHIIYTNHGGWGKFSGFSLFPDPQDPESIWIKSLYHGPGAGDEDLYSSTGAHRLDATRSKEVLLAITAAELYEGDFVGIDGTPADGDLGVLELRDGGRLGFLVVSGNASFESGPRAKLFELISRLASEPPKDT